MAEADEEELEERVKDLFAKIKLDKELQQIKGPEKMLREDLEKAIANKKKFNVLLDYLMKKKEGQKGGKLQASYKRLKTLKDQIQITEPNLVNIAEIEQSRNVETKKDVSNIA